MDSKALFLACRSGDLALVKYLVMEKDVNINVRDRWDSSPLFYACLCGHEEVVKFLLDNGARCEMNTFDGERCLYGSLTNAIRNLIRDYKQVTSSTMRRSAYHEFLRKLFESGVYSDITFCVHGHKYYAHRCILAARSAFFRDMLATKWKEKDIVNLNNRLLSPPGFGAVLSYLYTQRFDVDLDEADSVLQMARQCGLTDLITQLNDKLRHARVFQASRPNVHVTVLNVEPLVECTTLQDDFSVLGVYAVPSAVGLPNLWALPFWSECGSQQVHADVIYRVEGLDFRCHKAFFNCRSDYFRALEKDYFNEHDCAEESSHLPVISIHGVSPETFTHIVQYVYSDYCEVDKTSVFEVLYASEEYLLPGLKRLCGSVLSSCLSTENIVHILRTARLFEIARLENDCAAFMAVHLETVLQDTEFARLVREDASSVFRREETDSIPIIDDIRYHLTSDQLEGGTSVDDCDYRLAQIDAFLMTLGLEG